MKNRCILVCLSLALVSARAAATDDKGKYRLVDTIKLAGESGWDFLTTDAEAKLLYITRGDHVTVFHTGTGKEVGEIGGTKGVHGVALAKELKRGFVSSGAADAVTIFDLDTFKNLGTVATGKNPDAIVYQPVGRLVLAFNAVGKSVTVIDAQKGGVTGTLDLGGKPEFAVADPSGRVFVNIEDKSLLIAIDPLKPAKVAEWPIIGCEEPTGLALDAPHRRLFAGCHNEVLVVMDADSGKVVATLPIGKGVDAVAFDPATQGVFSSNGEGNLTVIHEDSPDHFVVADTVTTQKSARTMALDPLTHRIYTVAAKFAPDAVKKPAPGEKGEGEQKGRNNEQHKRPAMIPGSAVLLIFERA